MRLNSSSQKSFRNESEKTAVLNIKSGNKDAFVQLVALYKDAIRSAACSFSGAEQEREDLFQEGCIALYSAALVYDAERASFATFANLCIKRRMLNWIEKNFGGGVKFRSLSEMDDSQLSDIGIFSDDFEDSFVRADEISEIFSEVRSLLSKLEADVFYYFVKGYSNSEICHILSISSKSCENAVFRIKSKLRSIKR